MTEKLLILEFIGQYYNSHGGLCQGVDDIKFTKDNIFEITFSNGDMFEVVVSNIN